MLEWSGSSLLISFVQYQCNIVIIIRIIALILVSLSSFLYPCKIVHLYQGEYLQVDLGVVRQITHIALQGRPQSSEFVKTFYLKYGNNGLDFNSYGQNATVKYKVLVYYCTLEFYKCSFIRVLISVGLLPKTFSC